jgi:BirA family biotin operon repressor/biotin-[acetyl-CoA-carboxylase] ligase
VKSTTSFSFQKHFVAETDSTNKSLLRSLAESDLPEAYLLQSAHQTDGKGQGDAFWESEAGKNLLFSFVLRPQTLQVQQQFYLSIIVSLALRQTVRDLLPERDIRIKWPNDIYAGAQKIAGILIENALRGANFEWVVVGVGLNVNQTEFISAAPNPVSLKMLMGKDVDVSEVLQRFENYFAQYYRELNEGSLEKLKDEYLHRLYRRGVWKRFRDQNGNSFEGRISGIDAFGFLRIETREGMQSFDVKEVQYL